MQYVRSWYIFLIHMIHTHTIGVNNFFFSWRDSPLVGLGLPLLHEDFCGF